MATQNQDRLRDHFADHPTSTHPSRWDALWKDGSFLPWDRGLPNPALTDLLKCSVPPISLSKNRSLGAPNEPVLEKNPLPKPIKDDGSRARVLVPGCGKGYDVALFAAHGYDTFGLEISESAVQAAREFLKDPGEGEGGEYMGLTDANMRGKMEVLLGDYFADEWLKGIEGSEKGFDVIYDITFLCAFPLELRPKWAKRTAELLAKDGVLVCLEFPTHKPPSSGGPPWSLPAVVHAELLKQPGEDIQYDDKGVVVQTDRPAATNALVRFMHYVPKHTHKAGIIEGVVRDSVSIWRHAS